MWISARAAGPLAPVQLEMSADAYELASLFGDGEAGPNCRYWSLINGKMCVLIFGYGDGEINNWQIHARDYFEASAFLTWLNLKLLYLRCVNDRKS